MVGKSYGNAPHSKEEWRLETVEQNYKYNPQDYEEMLCQYMTEFYRAYEEKDTMRMRIYMEPLFSETKYAMKEGHISAAMRDEMLKYFWGLCE